MSIFSVSDAFGLVGKAVITFITNIPPTRGRMEIEPSSGSALVTQFTIKLTGWQDVDNPNIVYNLYYTVSLQVVPHYIYNVCLANVFI